MKSSNALTHNRPRFSMNFPKRRWRLQALRPCAFTHCLMVPVVKALMSHCRSWVLYGISTRLVSLSRLTALSGYMRWCVVRAPTSSSNPWVGALFILQGKVQKENKPSHFPLHAERIHLTLLWLHTPAAHQLISTKQYIYSGFQVTGARSLLSIAKSNQSMLQPCLPADLLSSCCVCPVSLEALHPSKC